MPNPPQAYNVPHFDLQTGESADAGAAFLALADMLSTTLAARGPITVRTDQVEQLSGQWPEIVLAPVSVRPRSLSTPGNQAGFAHTGGTRLHDLTVRLYAAAGVRTMAAADLYSRGARIVLDVDRVLADNRTLGGQVQETASAGDPQWKPYRFGDLVAVGWEWMLLIKLKYSMEAG